MSPTQSLSTIVEKHYVTFSPAHNECTKVQNPRRPCVGESIIRVCECWKGRAIETQGWVCTLLEAL